MLRWPSRSFIALSILSAPCTAAAYQWSPEPTKLSPGFSLYREVELYVLAGFTPMEALQAVTIVPARAVSLDQESGTVEPGKSADLDVLERNPLENIRDIRTVRMVLANGALYDHNQRGAHRLSG